MVAGFENGGQGCEEEVEVAVDEGDIEGLFGGSWLAEAWLRRGRRGQMWEEEWRDSTYEEEHDGREQQHLHRPHDRDLE